MSHQPMVWDDENQRPRRRSAGEPIIGSKLIFPVVLNTTGTTSAEGAAANPGSSIYSADRFLVFEAFFDAFVSQTGGAGTGVVQLYNYTTAAEIDRLSILAGDSFVRRQVAITLPSAGYHLIGCRLWRATGGGTVIVHAATIDLTE